MANNSENKGRILKLLEILNNETDDNHHLKQKDLVTKLISCGFDCNRQTVSNDLNVLMNSNVDVIKDNGYYIGSREFQFEELQMLMAAISSARFIPKEQSENIRKALTRQTSKHRAEELNNSFNIKPIVKESSGNMFVNINRIQEAIASDYNIEINYIRYEFVPGKSQVQKYVKKHILSPYAFIWKNDNFYLVASDDNPEHTNLSHYRIDRIKKVEFKKNQKRRSLSDLEGNYTNNFDWADYASKVFDMFSGENKKVIIEFVNEKYLVTEFWEKFGHASNRIKISELHDNETAKLRIETDVVVSKGLITYLMGFGSQVKVIEPKDLAENIKKQAKEIYDLYQ